LKLGLSQQKAAVTSSYWPLFRYNPDRAEQGLNPFQLDSRPPKTSLKDYMYKEGRFEMLRKSHPDRAAKLLELAQTDVESRWADYSLMAGLSGNGKGKA
jgi:pyruvate-ferredoxin/flavodoxin oxidoreductase